MLTRPLIRWILTGLALTAFAVENSFDFIGSVPYFRRLNGGLGILDLLPFPDPERAHRALEGLGAVGRWHYTVLLVTFDIAFPLTLALFFSAWLKVLFPGSGSFARAIRWLPWATLTLDYAENIACGVLIATFPHEPSSVASLAGALTALKLFGYGLSVFSLLVRFGLRLVPAKMVST